MTVPQLEPAPADGRPSHPLFVYGTLQPGEVRWFALAGRVVGEPVADHVHGSLYDTGWGYPAWVPEPDGEVPGLVLHLDPATAEETWAEVCRIEGGVDGSYAPVRTVTTSGRQVLAFPHLAPPGESLPAGFRRIAAWRGGAVELPEPAPPA